MGNVWSGQWVADRLGVRLDGDGDGCWAGEERLGGAGGWVGEERRGGAG
ncbi:hypothetical protein GA0115260_112391, partial [Streptomyces sp. MnatMP-M27]